MKIVAKQILALLTIVAMFSVMGCSTTAENLAQQKQWESYYTAKMAQVNKPQQKQFDVNVGQDGKFQGVTIYAVAPTVNIERPKKDYHPAWAIGGNILQAAVPYLGMVGTAKVVGDNMVDLAKATQGSSTTTTTTYTNSNNTAGQDYAGGDMANAVSGDTIGADYYSAGGDVATSADVDSSMSVGNDYAGNDYYPDSSDNSNNSTATNDNSVTNPAPAQ